MSEAVSVALGRKCDAASLYRALEHDPHGENFREAGKEHTAMEKKSLA